MSTSRSAVKSRITRAAGAITLCLSPIVGLTACSTYTYPNTCIINETVVDTPIETRNYTPSRKWTDREFSYCLNPTTAKYESCMKDVEYSSSASFEWRYVGTENWAHESREPEGKDNTAPYRRVKEYDVQVCDGRAEYADINGSIRSHRSVVSYYI